MEHFGSENGMRAKEDEGKNFEEDFLSLVRSITDQSVSDKDVEKQFYNFIFKMLDNDRVRVKEWLTQSMDPMHKHRPALAKKLNNEMAKGDR